MLNNRKKTIGVFVCKLPEYFQRTLCGALADEAVANGYNLVVFSTFLCGGRKQLSLYSKL